MNVKHLTGLLVLLFVLTLAACTRGRLAARKRTKETSQAS